MKLIQLTPGTGSFHCGNCVRDNALVTALRRQGHDCLMVPMYLPMVTDGIDATSENTHDVKVQFGGINAYLQQQIPLLRHTPKLIDSLLDRIFNHPGLLRWSSRFAGMTKARDLGDMTVSMLNGLNGNQRKEILKLCDQLEALQQIEKNSVDAVHLSNCLLSGLAAPLKDRLQCQVACTLMGEDSWIDALPEPQRTQVWESISQNAKNVDYFIAVSQDYAERMSERLALPDSKVKVIHNGIDLAGMNLEQKVENDSLTLGYFARLIPAKGLHHLIDAFIKIKSDSAHTSLKLKVGGAKTPAEEKYLQQQIERLTEHNLMNDCEFTYNLSRSEKLEFLNSINLLCVPVTYAESFGMYAVEAWAAGVPTLLPATGAFPELVNISNAGMVFEDHADLTIKLDKMLKDHHTRKRMSSAGMDSSTYFSHDRMARQFADIFKNT